MILGGIVRTAPSLRSGTIFFRNDCNGGLGNIYQKWGEARSWGVGGYNEGDEKFLKSFKVLHSWQWGANPPPPPFFMKTRPGSSLKGHYRRQSPGDVLGDVEIIEKHLQDNFQFLPLSLHKTQFLLIFCFYLFTKPIYY